MFVSLRGFPIKTIPKQKIWWRLLMLVFFPVLTGKKASEHLLTHSFPEGFSETPRGVSETPRGVSEIVAGAYRVRTWGQPIHNTLLE